jgi:phosphatidate cytidylyltransferase
LRRATTSLVGIPLLILIVWLGSPWTVLLVLGLSLFAMMEFHRLIERTGLRSSLAAGCLMTIAIVLTFQFRNQVEGQYLSLIPAGAFVVSLIYTSIGKKRMGFRDWASTVAGALYVGFLLSHALLLRDVGNNDEGRNWVLFGLTATFATDSGAYFTGTAIGRHLLVPSISPKKTWEGAIGGLVCATGISLVCGAILHIPAPVWQQALLGLALGIAAEVGDLVESRIKRAAHVKEAGDLVPGHGGILDRLDSVFFTMPVLYYLVVFALGR